MADDTGSSLGTKASSKRTAAQMLLARGLIDQDDYAALGRVHGFVESPPQLPTRRSMGDVAAWVGWGLALLSGVAEIMSQAYPQIEGPLETLGKIARLVAQSL